MNPDEETPKLFFWGGICWNLDFDWNGDEIAVGHCSTKGCHCKLKKSKDSYSQGEYKYDCVRCSKQVVLDKPIEARAEDFMDVILSNKYRNAEVINIDGELIKIQREEVKDDNYWIDAKISKNIKGELQLMVLAGSKKDKDKTQLFLDPTHERLAFDQNNDHPTEIFTKVEAIFKNSKSTIDDNK